MRKKMAAVVLGGLVLGASLYAPSAFAGRGRGGYGGSGCYDGPRQSWCGERRRDCGGYDGARSCGEYERGRGRDQRGLRDRDRSRLDCPGPRDCWSAQDGGEAPAPAPGGKR